MTAISTLARSWGVAHVPSNLSVDGKIWARCRFCTLAIWRYPGGKLWRTYDMQSGCGSCLGNRHAPEW